MEMTKATRIIETGNFKTEGDFLKLDIVDWNRLNGYWENTGDALYSISSWLINTSRYTIIATDLHQAPSMSDFPGWDHVGGHESIGKLYWNRFHAYQKGTLVFSDAPDFYGTIEDAHKGIHRFYGDIGKVSPSTLAHTQRHLLAGDLWISVLNTQKQVIIEPFVDLVQLAPL